MHQLNSNDLSTALNASRTSIAIQGKQRNKTNQLAYLWGGHALVSLGFIGMLLPLLPTTVFWVGATICYAKSSPRLYKQLIEHKRFGKAIRNYIECGIISSKAKWAATLTMSFSAVLLWLAPLNFLFTLCGLCGLAIAATFVITRPSNFISARVGIRIPGFD